MPSPAPAASLPQGRTAPSRPGVRGSAVPPILLGLAVAGMVAATLTSLSTADALLELGVPDPGVLTTYGLPAVQAVGEGAAVVAIGCVLLAAFLVPPQRSGVVSVDGYRALRTAAAAATTWAGSAALLVPLSLSDASGRPLHTVLDPAVLLSSVGQVDASVSWLWTSMIALVLAISCRLTLRWRWTPALLVLALLSLMPLGLSGHSSAGESYDVATSSLVLHLVAATLWAGGLAALLLHARAGGGDLYVATRRFSSLALVSFVVVGMTGVVNALAHDPPSELVGSTYGALVLAKVGALIVLGGFGWAQRRATVAALATDPARRRPLVRLAAAELLVLAATVGLAVALSRTPPPEDDDALPSLVEAQLGYDLTGPPTLGRLALDWRFDLIFGTAALVLAGVYLIGVRRLRRRGDAWATGRTIAFLSGCLVLLFATSSGVGRYSPAVFSVHMGSHLALAVLVPVLLVLGAPVTLALRALPVAARGDAPGPREWLVAALHSRVSAAMTHPVVALGLFVGSFYALYLGGLFELALGSHVANVLVNAHVLITGYLFFWVTIGVDPTARPPSSLTKLALVLAALPFLAFVLVVLIGSDTTVGESFYEGLGLSWNQDLAADQRLGVRLAWGAGGLPLVAVIIARWACSGPAATSVRSAGRAAQTSSTGSAGPAAQPRPTRPNPRAEADHTIG